MLRPIRYAVVLLLLLAIACVAQAQDEPPIDFLTRYINAINMHDYTAAYAMRVTPQQSYVDFVAGYKDTAYIVPYFGFTGVAAGSTYVTTVLLGYNTDGTVDSFYGYFQVTSGQSLAPVINIDDWVLLDGVFEQLPVELAVHNTPMQTLLEMAYTQNPVVDYGPPLLSAMDNSFSRGMLNYYDAINEGDFVTAYNTWLSPTNSSITVGHGPTYKPWVDGYSDTSYITVYAGDAQAWNSPFNANANPAANTYLAAYLPVVLLSQHTDKTFEAFSGCYLMGLKADGSIGIVSGKVFFVQDSPMDAETLFTTLNNLACHDFNLPQ